MGEHENNFVWDSGKERLNILKHGVDFKTAAKVFRDPDIQIYADKRHSAIEIRFFALGKIHDEVLTVRFTYREGKIRIIGAGFWRGGKKRYESQKE